MLTALLCVVAALLLAVVVLAVCVVRLRAQGRRTARDGIDNSLSNGAVKGEVEKELDSLWPEFIVARVDASAAAVEARPGKQGAAAAPPPDDPNERDASAAPAERTASEPPAPAPPDEAPVVGVGAALEGEPTTFWMRPSAAGPAPLPEPDAHKERDAPAVPSERPTPVPDGTDDGEPAALEGEPTFIWTEDEAASVRAAAEAGGAHRSPQDAPSAPLSVAVAPPASASAPLEVANFPCNHERPKSASGAQSTPGDLARGETLVGLGVPSLQAQGAATPAPVEVIDWEVRDTMSPELASGNDDGETAPLSEPEKTASTQRVPILRPLAPLAEPDLLGTGDISEEAAVSYLGSEETTRPEGLKSRWVTTCPAPKERGA